MNAAVPSFALFPAFQFPLYLLTTGGACTSAELRAMETLVHARVYGQAPAAEQ